MKKITTLAVVALMASAAPVFMAHAQDEGAAMESEEALDSQSDMASESGESALEKRTYADLMTALDASQDIDTAIVGEDTTIELVLMSELQGDEEANADTFAQAQSDYEAAIARTQSQVSENAMLTAALNAQGYAPEDAIALWTDGEGSLVFYVYVDDRA